MAHHKSNIGFFAVIGGSLLAAALLVALLVSGRVAGPKSGNQRLATNNCTLMVFLGDVWGHVVALSGVDPRGGRQQRRPYRTRSSATARAESCATSWTPACAILMICFAIISVSGRRDP